MKIINLLKNEKFFFFSDNKLNVMVIVGIVVVEVIVGVKFDF